MKRRSKRRVRNDRIKSRTQWTRSKRENGFLFSGYNSSADRLIKECEYFHLEYKKGKSLRDILTGVNKYGISEKEARANVFGGYTYRGPTNEIQVFCMEENY